MTKALHVLHLAKGSVAHYHGGPSLLVHLMLQGQEHTKNSTLAMSAVFDDAFIYSCEESTHKTRSFYQRGGDSIRQRVAQRIFPRTLRFLVGVAFSTLRFLFHMERAVRKVGRSHHIVFHSHDLISAYLCRLRYHQKYPLIFTMHSKGGAVREAVMQYPIFRGTFVERILKRIEAITTRHADIITFPSSGARTLFENEYPGLLNSKDVRVVYTGANTEELDSVTGDANLLAKYVIGPENLVVLCIGALIKDKGIDTLIEAMALLPEDVRSRLSCLIVGRGQLEGELQSLIAEKGLQDKVKLLGFLPRQELLQLMKSVTAFVLPSRADVFPYVLLEVGAMALPVIATTVGGNLETFDEDSALLVPPDEPRALAAAITRLLTDGELRKQLSESVYHRVRCKFSLESMFNSYLAIYEEVAKRYGDRSLERKKPIT